MWRGCSRKNSLELRSFRVYVPRECITALPASEIICVFMYMLTRHLCSTQWFVCCSWITCLCSTNLRIVSVEESRIDRLTGNLLLLGRQSFSLEYGVMRKCSATAQINDFRRLFSLAGPLCVCPNGRVTVWICVCRVLRAAVDKSCILPSLCHSNIICWFLSQEEELERLEREFAIQSQITEAARRLASDPHVNSKKLKKQRKTSYLNALKKLQEIENSINEYRVRSGKKPTQRASLIIEGTCAFYICFFLLAMIRGPCEYRPLH